MKKSKQYHVVNYMEELVDVTLKGLISDLPKSSRPTSRTENDIKALALNRLWPMYVTSKRGERFVKRDIVSDGVSRDVRRELAAAIERVQRHPAR